MSHFLSYQIEEGKSKREKFASYYECISRKECLRREGIKTEYWANGGDEKKRCIKKHISDGDKQAIKKFLQACDNFRDYKNQKAYHKKSIERSVQ